MPAVAFNSTPVEITWPIVRGDDENLPLVIANPGGYTITRGSDGYETASVSSPFGLSGRTYSGSVARTRGGTAVTTLTVTIDSAANGQLTLSLSDTQTDALTESSYIFDLVENAGTSSETTLIIGKLRVSGRATA
jgi:hypothetical protein